MSVAKLLKRGVAAVSAALLAFTLAPAHQQARAAEPSVSLLSAPSSGPVGASLTARAKVTPSQAGLTGFAQVFVNGGWVALNPQATTNSTGEFSVALSYGVSTPGTYRYRLGATVSGVPAYTREFNVVRTASVSLMSAPSALSVGVTGTAKARTTPARSGYPAFAEVWTGSRWARVSSATTTSSGDFSVPLRYGVGQAGSHSFRLGAVIGGKTFQTRQFTLTRRVTAANLPTTFAGFTRYLEYGSGEWVGAPEGSSSVAYWYEGTLNGNFGSIVASNVQRTSLSALAPSLFTGVAAYGANKCGTWLGVYTACFVPKGNGFRGVQIPNSEFGSRPSHSQVLNLALALASRT